MSSNVLAGITRNVLLEILELDLPVENRDFTIDELLSASEVFLTASGKELTPVTAIDGQLVGDGKVGPVTKEAMRQFHKYTASDLWWTT
jgi:branched-subunit amino acid aminotransferase/4-amino-4-deoxychorismate lyase